MSAESTYTVEWAEIARQDLDEIVDYVASESPATASKVIDLINGRRNLEDIIIGRLLSL